RRLDALELLGPLLLLDLLNFGRHESLRDRADHQGQKSDPDEHHRDGDCPPCLGLRLYVAVADGRHRRDRPVDAGPGRISIFRRNIRRTCCTSTAAAKPAYLEQANSPACSSTKPRSGEIAPPRDRKAPLQAPITADNRHGRCGPAGKQATEGSRRGASAPP